MPLLFNPVFANYMQAYGAGGLKASRLDACELLARLYWYTVEFGLIATPAGLRAYGAGILSSAGELRHSVASTQPRRIAFELPRLMRTKYRIDSYQASYFVIRSFDELFAATAPDFTPVYRDVRARIADRWRGRGGCRVARRAHVQLSQRTSSCQGSGRLAMCTWATAGKCRLSAPTSVAVEGGKTMLSQWL